MTDSPDRHLGCEEEFDQAHPRGEAEQSSEVSFGLFAAERDALEALEPCDALLDAGAGLVEGACEEGWLVPFVGLVGDNGSDAARSRGVPIGLAGVAFVADDGAGLNVGADIEQGFEMTPAEGFAAGQVEGDYPRRRPILRGFSWSSGHATARALALLAPLC